MWINSSFDILYSVSEISIDVSMLTSCLSKQLCASGVNTNTPLVLGLQV